MASSSMKSGSINEIISSNENLRWRWHLSSEAAAENHRNLAALKESRRRRAKSRSEMAK